VTVARDWDVDSSALEHRRIEASSTAAKKFLASLSKRVAPRIDRLLGDEDVEMGIVRFALKYPYTFYVLAAFILFVGVSTIIVMPEDIFPEIKIPVVSVIWQYDGLGVPEMEQRITTYSEYSISTTVTGIKDMEAPTLNGISVLKIYFQPDVNLDLAISQIVATTNAVRSVMPAGIQPPHRTDEIDVARSAAFARFRSVLKT
jgi:multidrug efflux pump subunit AcrB